MPPDDLQQPASPDPTGCVPGETVDLRIGATFHQVDGWFHAGNATIVGDVRIGSGCGIWYGAVLRGDDAPIVLGERVNVQDLSVLHADPEKPLIIGDDVTIGHEASVSKVNEEQLFYLMSRGLSEEEATTMIVAGFIEPLVKELPMEYAIEMNRLIQLQMEGSVG